MDLPASLRAPAAKGKPAGPPALPGRDGIYCVKGRASRDIGCVCLTCMRRVAMLVAIASQARGPASASHPASSQRFQELRGSHGSRHPYRADRSGRAQWLRQVEPSRGAALGYGRDPAQGDARRRDGGRDLSGQRRAPGARLCRGDAADRQFRAACARGLQRRRHDRDRPPHHPRCRFDLQGRRQGGPRARRADALRRCVDGGAFARAGAPGPDRGADQCAPARASAHPRGGGGHFRALPAPPRGRAAAQGDGGQSLTRR